MCSPYTGSPRSVNGGSRPSSITRSSRENFASELETLPSESMEYFYELNEEVLDIEDVSDNDDSVDDYVDDSVDDLSESTPCFSGPIESVKIIEDEVIDENNAANRKEASSAESSSSVESELDIKIRKGLKKVKKLDKILHEKMEKEKEAKRSRRAVEKEFQSQVAKLIQEKGADKVCGSQQLLYLCATSDRSEHVEDNDAIEPIFPTQIDAEYYKDKIDGIPSSNPQTVNTSENRDATENGERLEKKSKTGKDFVKRNIKLASQAQELIPLTDEERKRLDELLADDSDLLLVENPFSTPSLSISGYQFSNEELDTLENIDAQLKELIPIDEFTLAIGGSQLNEVEKLDYQCTDGGEISSTSNGEIVIPEGKCGEHVLQEGYDERTVVCRLRNIEEKLARLQFNDEEGVGSLIDPDLLRKLLDVDSRLTSDSISICDSLRSKSVLYSDVDATTIGSEIGSDFDIGNAQFDVTVN